MDDAEIQYCTTPDGVSLALHVIGGGPPIVFVPGAFANHLQYTWRTEDQTREFMQRLAEMFTVVCFDARGSGLSDRDARDYSLATRAADLGTVVDHLGLDTFALKSVTTHGGPVAINYAVHNAERVTHLVLSNVYVRGGDWYTGRPNVAAVNLLRPVAAESWDFVSRVLGLASAGFANPAADWSRAERFAARIRASMDGDAYFAFRDAVATIDLSELLPRINVPTLVAYYEDLYTARWAQEIASKVRGSKLVALDRALGELAELPHMLRFIGGEPGNVTPPARSMPRAGGAFRTILFTDIENSTLLNQRLGDTAYRTLLREHESITRDLLHAHRGTEVKTTGDGFMASFSSVVSAMECAVALQRAFASRNAATDDKFTIRVGLNAGEPVEEHGDLFGEAVTLASRITAQGSAGDILLPDPVRHLLAGKGFIFTDRGEFLAKGFEDPVRLYEVRWHE